MIGNKPVTISGEPSKQPNEHIKQVEEHFNNNNPRSMWQGINNITGFKGSKPATVNIAASLPDELNTFYARFEADNTAHTESAAAAAAEEVSPLTLSVADVTRSFKRVNIRKAVGPDGIPGRVLKACAFQVSTLTKWCQENHLSLNIDKTKELVVDYRRQSREHTPITIDKTPVERVTSLSSSAFTSPRISHGLLTQMQCWRRHISVSSSWDGWGSLERAPESSGPSTPALWRASWPAVSPPGLETAPLATAGLCKGSCELPATLLEVSFPPSRISTPGGVQGSPEDYQRLQPPVPQTALSAALRATFPQHPIPH